MTEQEAIKQIKSGEWVDDPALEVVNGIAISAIEKQIPMQPDMRDRTIHRIYYRCANTECGRPICFDDNYCRHCGQRISWTGIPREVR